MEFVLPATLRAGGDERRRAWLAELPETVRSFAALVTAPGSALPAGRPLASAEEPEQDLVLASLLPRLWRAPVAERRFRPLSELCEAWAAEFERRPAGLDPGLARLGLALFRTLPGSAERSVLLATDLHAGNVLAAEREPWLMIDPKPYVGDPAFDVLQHALNCDRLAADPRGLAARLAGLLELDPERVALWLFARCVIGSADQPELGAVAVALRPG